MRARFMTTEYAEPGATFAPDAFASQIGKQVPVTGAEGTALLLAGVVADDGRSAKLTFECELEVVDPAPLAMSLQVTDDEDPLELGQDEEFS